MGNVRRDSDYESRVSKSQRDISLKGTQVSKRLGITITRWQDASDRRQKDDRPEKDGH